MSASSPPGSSRPPNTGFTLIELLVVMGVIVVLLTLVRPAVTSISRGQNFAGNVYDVDYLVRQAKAAAMAQNSFVWLGFQNTTSGGSPVVAVVMVVSRSGLSSDVSSNASPTPVPTATPTSTPYQLATKPMILPNIQLDSTGSLGATPAAYRNLSGFDSTYNVDVSQSGYTFSQAVPGVTTTAFTAVIGFSPAGAASLGTTTAVRTIGIGLKSTPTTSPNAQIAAIQISGLNGRSTVFRQ